MWVSSTERLCSNKALKNSTCCLGDIFNDESSQNGNSPEVSQFPYEIDFINSSNLFLPILFATSWKYQTADELKASLRFKSLFHSSKYLFLPSHFITVFSSCNIPYLTKKQKINNGEVQQYYVENNHPAIIEPDVFEMVRLEIDRRLMLKGKYSGTDILTAKIRCGECGGSYGAKVWHSNDKYRRVMYQCNSKYSGKEKCKTPAIRSEDIESRFVNVVNILIESKDEIISNLEKVLDKICNKKELLEEKEKLENSLTEQVEKIQDLIDINSRVAQNQEKYKKEYDALIKNYDETKCKFEQLEIKLSQQAAKHQMIKDYINTLKKQEKLLTKFDGLVWGSLLESATIKDKDVIVFRFKDGTEING